MQIPPFTIIYRGPRQAAEGSALDQGDAAPARLSDQIRQIGRVSPRVATRLEALDPALGRTLVESACQLASSRLTGGAGEVRKVARTLRPVVADLARAPRVETVAVWDLDAHVGGLPRAVAALNRAQTAFTFLNLQAPLPAGLVARREAFLDWANSRRGRSQKIDEGELKRFDNNLMSNDFYKHARVVHKALGVGYTVGVTRQMIAGYAGGELFWNYFADSSGHILLVSAYGLRDYARAAGRPFEAALAGLIVSQLLVATNSRLRYHEDTGCLFDFNGSRDSVVESLRRATIEPQCMDKIDEGYRAAAAAMVGALRSYEPEEEEAPADDAPSPPSGPKHDDRYWLEQLRKLSKPRKG